MSVHCSFLDCDWCRFLFSIREALTTVTPAVFFMHSFLYVSFSMVTARSQGLVRQALNVISGLIYFTLHTRINTSRWLPTCFQASVTVAWMLSNTPTRGQTFLTSTDMATGGGGGLNNLYLFKKKLGKSRGSIKTSYRCLKFHTKSFILLATLPSLICEGWNEHHQQFECYDANVWLGGMAFISPLSIRVTPINRGCLWACVCVRVQLECTFHQMRSCHVRQHDETQLLVEKTAC